MSGPLDVLRTHGFCEAMMDALGSNTESEDRQCWERLPDSQDWCYACEQRMAALAAVEQLASAAEPMARLPIPLSTEERTEWLTNQNRLRDVLDRFQAGSPADTPREPSYIRSLDELAPGDVIELTVFTTQFGYQRERRTVVSVDPPVLSEDGREYEWKRPDEDIAKARIVLVGSPADTKEDA